MSTPLRTILMDFTRLEGVQGAAIVSKDGFVVESVISANYNPEAVAAMVTTLANAAIKLSEELNLGDLDIVIGEYVNNYLLVKDLGSAYIVVVTDKRAVLGRIRYELEKQKERTKAAL